MSPTCIHGEASGRACRTRYMFCRNHAPGTRFAPANVPSHAHRRLPTGNGRAAAQCNGRRGAAQSASEEHHRGWHWAHLQPIPLTAGPTYSEAGTGPTALHGVGLFCVGAGARPTATAAEKAERRAEQHDAVPCRAGSAGWAAWRARGSARQRRGLRTAKDGTVRHLERKLVLQRRPLQRAVGTGLWCTPSRVLSRR